MAWHFVTAVHNVYLNLKKKHLKKVKRKKCAFITKQNCPNALHCSLRCMQVGTQYIVYNKCGLMWRIPKFIIIVHLQQFSAKHTLLRSGQGYQLLLNSWREIHVTSSKFIEAPSHKIHNWCYFLQSCCATKLINLSSNSMYKLKIWHQKCSFSSFSTNMYSLPCASQMIQYFSKKGPPKPIVSLPSV